MRGRNLAFIAVLVGSISAPYVLGQDNEKVRKREVAAFKKQEEQQDRRAALLESLQPAADRYARAMLLREYRDPLARSYVSSLGQRLVPPETPSSITFSFRIVNDIVPNASALPDGRIYVTTGLLAQVETEAQLAMVLGHEIGHVLEEHHVEGLQRRGSAQRRGRVIGALAGGAVGGILGGKSGGAAQAMQGVATGMGAGVLISSVVTGVIRAKFGREQEKEADLVGADVALAQGFDPGEGVRYWARMDELFGRRSFSSKVDHLLFGSHPVHRVRAANLRTLLAGDLSATLGEKRASGELSTGSGRFGSMMSGLMRDTGTMVGELSDRHDLALGLLERAQRYRPGDPRLLWALGRTHRMIARTPEQLAKTEELLLAAADLDKRGIYPAINRDLAYALAGESGDFGEAAEKLKLYVTGHIAAHGRLPFDIDEIYDMMVLFGENSWVPEVQRPASPQLEGAMPVSTDLAGLGSLRHHPTIWDSPANTVEYRRALIASGEVIEVFFGGAVED